jgi:Domain of unknown function (DUF4168)
MWILVESRELRHSQSSHAASKTATSQTWIGRGGANPTVTKVDQTMGARPNNRELGKQSDKSSQMPTMFDEQGTSYDLYAACLAATEGLRRFREEQIAKASDQLDKANRSNRSVKKHVEEVERQASSSYVRDASKVVQGMGMSVDEFNDIGRQLQHDPTLKAKVSLCANGRSLAFATLFFRYPAFAVLTQFGLSGYGSSVSLSNARVDPRRSNAAIETFGST